MTKLTILILIILSLGCGQGSTEFTQDQSPENKVQEDEDSNIEKQFIVVFRPKVRGNLKVLSTKQRVNSMDRKIKKSYKATAVKKFSRGLSAAVYKMTTTVANEMAKDSDVAYIEEDKIISINANQNPAPWGLDRIDQASLPLDQIFKSSNNGEGVQVYVLDTGIRNTHQDFEGRSVSGTDTSDSDDDATDCNGHGTHVAGTIGGRVHGVAKKVNLIGVRVLDCRGSGRFSDVISGIEWVTNNHQKPAVANMSLGGGKSRAIDEAVEASIAAGVTYVVAAGNSNRDACSSSPAGVPAAITVGSSTRSDSRSSFSNFGACVDLFAPGSDITSTWIGSDTDLNTISGTSMASPHVAGAAALYLSNKPLASPDEVAQALVANAGAGLLGSVGVASPNLLLNIGFLNDVPTQEPEPEVLEKENLSGRRRNIVRFEINIPKGAKKLNVKLSGGSGDADLYVRLGQRPTTNSFDCRPYTTGNNESCEVESPTAKKAYIMIRAYRDYRNVKLEAIAL